jgi:hypothetical protein
MAKLVDRQREDINEEVAQERVESLVRMYKNLFVEELDEELDIEAIKLNIKKLILKDDHPQAIPFSSSTYSKKTLNNCLIAAEIEEFKNLIHGNKLDKIKQIIVIFKEFNDPRLDKLELWVLNQAIANKPIKDLSIIPPLADMTKELFETVVQSNPDIEKFSDLYNNTLEALGQTSQ